MTPKHDPIDGEPIPQDVPDPRELTGETCWQCGYKFRDGDMKSATGLCMGCTDVHPLGTYPVVGSCWISMADAVPVMGQQIMLRASTGVMWKWTADGEESRMPPELDWSWVPIEQVPGWMV